MSNHALTALVTGGAGFIGSNLVLDLLRDGWSVRTLDDFSTGKKEHLEPARAEIKTGRFELVRGDLRNPKTCLAACRDIQYVFHQGAIRSVPRSVDEPTVTNDVNITGTLNLLQAALKARVKRLIYASSSSVYGDTDTPIQQEDQTPRPVSPYAVSKLAGEHYCVCYWKVFGLETVSLRYFNVFGPHQDPESKYSAVIPAFIDRVKKGQTLEIHGDGLQSRDFTHVEDVVRANRLAASTPNAAGRVYNIACGTTHTVVDIANALVRILGRDPGRRHTRPRPGDVRRTHADISRAQSELGFTPQVSLEEGLERTVQYFNRGRTR